ncbi:MAG: hypothetical protein RMJ33_13570, partial [Saprospiraceae bacterium]|nr:hypothetical protein [Saprospiraceae bacterium]
WSLRMAGYAFAHPVLVFLLVFGLSSLAVFAATTLPSRTGIFLTDRARFFRLMGGGPEARAEQQMLHLIALDHSGFPWKKLNVEEYADARQDAAYGLYAELYAYWHYLDTGQREQALASAQRFEATPEDWPETLKVVLWKEACFAQAWLAADTDAARPWWERIHYFVKRQPDAAGLRAQAAWHMAQGDYAAGREAAKKALRFLDRIRHPTATVCAEKRLLKAMLSDTVACPEATSTPSA